MKALVAVVGSFNVDHVWTLDSLPVAGETRSGRYASGAGGKGFNQAIAAARSGAATRFVCALGSDAGGQYARTLAVAEDIDLRDATSDSPTGTAGIFVDAAGRNSIVVAPGANADVDAVHVRHALETADAASVVLAQLETPTGAAHAAFEIARSQGALTILNPAPGDATVPPALLALVNVLTPNETEFAALVRSHLGSDVEATQLPHLPLGQLHDDCRALLPNGTVVITLGASGVFVSHAPGATRGDAESFYRLPACRVRAVDTTGAGDAFNGALAASIATHPAESFASHARYAVAYAGLSTESAGAAMAMPRKDDVHRRFPGATAAT